MVWSRLVYEVIDVKFLHDTHPYINLYNSLFKHDEAIVNCLTDLGKCY